jgi:hypothetical protein
MGDRCPKRAVKARSAAWSVDAANVICRSAHPSPNSRFASLRNSGPRSVRASA